MMMRVENETPRKRKISENQSNSSDSSDDVQMTPTKRDPTGDGRVKRLVKSTPKKRYTLESTILEDLEGLERQARDDFARTFYARSLTDEFMKQPATSSAEFNAAGTQKDAVESGYDADISQLSDGCCEAENVDGEKKQ
ncbi:unnamed protein product [Caenorhabditis nigoni]